MAKGIGATAAGGGGPRNVIDRLNMLSERAAARVEVARTAARAAADRYYALSRGQVPGGTIEQADVARRQMQRAAARFQRSREQWQAANDRWFRAARSVAMRQREAPERVRTLMRRTNDQINALQASRSRQMLAMGNITRDIASGRFTPERVRQLDQRGNQARAVYEQAGRRVRQLNRRLMRLQEMRGRITQATGA